MISNNPELTENEGTLLYSQGGYCDHFRSGWKLGHHYLINKRLLFFQPSRIAFETFLSNITAITVERQKFVLATKNTIGITYTHPQVLRQLKAWIIMGDLETWRRKIYELTQLVIDEETINKIAERLDPDCADIVWYLWQRRHAKLDELADLIEAPTHMDVLLKIKRIINPAARRTIGNPILAFEQSRIDDDTGKKVLFSWWIVGRKRPEDLSAYNAQAGERRKALIDVFDEGDHIDVVVELPGIQEQDILLKVEKGNLTVSASTSDKKYHEDVPLPAGVNVKESTKRYNNSILEVRLEKVGDR